MCELSTIKIAHFDSAGSKKVKLKNLNLIDSPGLALGIHFMLYSLF